jgi:hypothetical protein
MAKRAETKTELQSPNDTARQVSVDLVIVHGDGTSTRVPGRYINL